MNRKSSVEDQNWLRVIPIVSGRRKHFSTLSTACGLRACDCLSYLAIPPQPLVNFSVLLREISKYLNMCRLKMSITFLFTKVLNKIRPSKIFRKLCIFCHICRNLDWFWSRRILALTAACMICRFHLIIDSGILCKWFSVVHTSFKVGRGIAEILCCAATYAGQLYCFLVSFNYSFPKVFF